MTAIAVRKYKDKIVISADSQVTHGRHKYGTSEKSRIFGDTVKIVRKGDIVVGTSGLVKKANYFKMYIETHVPKDSSFDSVDLFLLEFEDWYVSKKKGQDDDVLGIIFIVDNRIYQNSCGLTEEIMVFGATGSGTYLCIGALSQGASPQEAIEVAKDFDLYCGGETQTITISLTKTDEKK